MLSFKTQIADRPFPSIEKCQMGRIAFFRLVVPRYEAGVFEASNLKAAEEIQ
jgi:hypothetical protein